MVLCSTMSARSETAFPSSPPGQFEVKTLPAGTLLESKTDGLYFDNSSTLFRPLFRYIDERGISMTTPVEAAIAPGRMYFWVSEEDVDKLTGDTDRVRVVNVPARTVASKGGRGSYSEENFRESADELLDWVAKQDEWIPTGDPFAVYWNGPFTLWFLKKYEVMVEIGAVEG